MSRMPSVSVAFVRDWLTVYGGADRTMEAALELFPGAPIYALLYQAENFRGTRIAQHEVRTSFIERLPGGRRSYRTYLPLMPLAIEQLDLRNYELVISMSHVVAKGVLTRADQLHISYIYTPMRDAWDLYLDYLEELNLTRGVKSWAARLLLHYLRLWDTASSNRPDVFVADSQYVAQRIWKLYRRPAEVIYPPVDVDRFRPRTERGNFYLTVSRFVPYKKIALIVDAFSRLGLPLVVIGDGPDWKKVQRAAGANVQLLGRQADSVVKDYMERCKAFVYAADEDFGIVVVEAQAAGAPIIAYGRGGVTESVIPGENGVTYPEQHVESLTDAVLRFEASAHRFHPERVRLTTRRFSRERFQQAFTALVAREWEKFVGHSYKSSAVDERRSLAG